MKIESKDFFTCWKALSHSERVFKEAILRKDFPEGATEEEFLGFLADIKEVKDKIESLFRAEEPVEEVH
jgi:hypothetical protein